MQGGKEETIASAGGVVNSLRELEGSCERSVSESKVVIMLRYSQNLIFPSDVHWLVVPGDIYLPPFDTSESDSNVIDHVATRCCTDAPYMAYSARRRARVIAINE